MSVDDLLLTLTEHGVTVRADGDELCLRPASRVPSNLIAELRAAKPALLHRLAVAARVEAFRVQGQPWVLVPNLPYERARCFSCGDSLSDALFGRCAACREALRQVLMTDVRAAYPVRG
jgi:hypothetical protein